MNKKQSVIENAKREHEKRKNDRALQEHHARAAKGGHHTFVRELPHGTQTLRTETLKDAAGRTIVRTDSTLTPKHG